MNYVILALATWRLSSLLATEDGPYNLFERLRSRIGIYYDDYSNPQGKNELARMLMCVFCSSVWVGGVLTVAYWLFDDFVIWLAFPLALSAAAIGFDEWLRSDQ